MGYSVIRDGPSIYPESCCVYTRGRTADVRLMLARCRQREEILQKDLKRAETPAEVALTTVRLEEVQALLIFINTNCGVSDEKRGAACS